MARLPSRMIPDKYGNDLDRRGDEHLAMTGMNTTRGSYHNHVE
jgi:hypothetical protein